MPVSRNAHHSQFMLTPPVRTRSVTRFGVSVENVVATIDVPSSHHGSVRPDRKYCSRLRPARRVKYSPTTGVPGPYTATTTQSIGASCMAQRCRTASRPRNEIVTGPGLTAQVAPRSVPLATAARPGSGQRCARGVKLEENDPFTLESMQFTKESDYALTGLAELV